MRKDIIEFNCKEKVKSKSILDELDDLDNFSLPSSSIVKEDKEEKKDKKKKKKSLMDDSDNDYFGESDTDDWITSFKSPKIEKKRKPTFKGFGLEEGKKKKKKKKDKGVIDHKKDFDTEMILLKSLQSENSKFLDSLRKTYEQMQSTKSTARGIGKFTTDLITNINSSTTTSLQIIKEIASLKKSIADLDFRERKEFGAGKNSEQENITNYASTYLKQVMDVGRNNVVGQQTGYEAFDDADSDDDLFSSISENLGDDGRDEAANKFLQYENDNIEVRVTYHDNVDDNDLDNKYEFVAYNKDGDVVDDYPLPMKTQLNINRSTGVCSDIYGNKYGMDFA